MADWHYREETEQQHWGVLADCPECGADMMYNVTVSMNSKPFSQSLMPGSLLAICVNGHTVTEQAKENGAEEWAEERLG